MPRKHMERALPAILVLMTVACPSVLSGCATHRSVDLNRQTGGNAALFSQFRAYDAHTRRHMTFADLVERTSAADVVLFGEEHSDVVCNALEAQLLAALAQRQRPMTLAMEFFEIDTQAALDAYLAGRLAEDEFRKLTRQKRAYPLAHRPLIEYCRSASIPVIAANAPSRLVRAFRLSGKPYDEFCRGLEPGDRALLPPTSKLLTGRYYDQFVEAMADHITVAPASTQPTTSSPASAPSTQPDRTERLLRSYRAQSLWDDSMADSVVSHRGRFPTRRVMLIVGGFHVSGQGGAKVKLSRRRPHDKIMTIVYRGVSNASLPFDNADRGIADVMIYGLKPPDESTLPNPVPTSTSAQAPTM